MDFAQKVTKDMLLKEQHKAINKRSQKMTITRKTIWNQTSFEDVFIRAYLECALWSSTGDNDEPFDKDHDIDSFSDNAIEQAIKDSEEFLYEFHDTLLCLHQQCKYDQGKAGHDLWLTRCGHGTGFWDRDLHETGEKFTAMAKKMGNLDLLKGDDGELYFG